MPIRFTALAFEGGLVDFESPDQLKALRADLAETHGVLRTREGIACVPLRGDVVQHGTPTTFAVPEHRSLTIRLVQDALRRLVVGWGYQLRRPDRVNFVSRLPGKDLLVTAAGDRRPNGLVDLHVYPQYSLNSRIVGAAGAPGVLIDLKTRYEIDLTVAELINRGIDVRGLSVVADDGTRQPFPHMDPYGTRRYVGTVDRVDGAELVLRDAIGAERVPADAAWPASRREFFSSMITTLTGGDGARIVRRLEHETFALLGAAGRLKKITEIAGQLSQHPIDIAHGVSVTLEQPIGSSDAAKKVVWSHYDEPTFSFDQAGDKKNRSVDRGLDAFGPFDVEFFAKKKPRIAVVMPRAHKGIVEQFVTKFLHGVPGGGVFSQGFIRKFHLGGCDVHLEPFDGDLTDARAYHQACQAALLTGDVDLAIVITGEAQVHLTGNHSPYLVAKSAFMGQGVPVQEIRIETTQSPTVAHALNTIALACYAKLGGIPFVISAPRTLTHELVIGIGSAHVQADRTTEAERIVGITTVFSANGNYLLSSRSREADYDDYPRELLRSLTECINDVKARNAWQEEDEVRLVFHVFKPLKDTEAQAVKNLITSLTGQYTKVEFAFVHVGIDHDWVMFDRASAGVSRGTSRAKGHYVPDRGYAVAIGPNQMLLSVSGPMDLKSPTHGAPRPLLLNLHRESTFRDIEYLARQVFRFTSMSWRRMYPSSKPVTILYSDLIADLLGHLRHVKNWNADTLATKLRWSRWFL
ncbi:Piwi domain-containing protein [Amycolatopsis sp. NPDC049691]|uniref:argonaute/piwi family protein n=1 Tax=Amycolatopsis sp. NPDC049691 TaxID=3155155 RepID=UPI0034358325